MDKCSQHPHVHSDSTHSVRRVSHGSVWWHGVDAARDLRTASRDDLLANIVVQQETIATQQTTVLDSERR